MSRRSRRTSQTRLYGQGELEALTGPASLPLAVRLDHELEDMLPALPAPRAQAAVYPWASPRPLRPSLLIRTTPRLSAKRRQLTSIDQRATYVKRYSTLRTLQMQAPNRVAFCIARKQRREIIFATRKNGRNGGRFYKRTATSQYRC